MGSAYTERWTEVCYPLAIEYSDDLGPAATASAYVSFANYHRGILIINVGDMGQTATLDALLQQATTTAGAGVKAITGKAITQLTQAGGDGNDLVAIEFRTEELDVANGFDCVRFVITTGVAAVEYGAMLLGIVSRFDPVPTTNWTEIID